MDWLIPLALDRGPGPNSRGDMQHTFLSLWLLLHLVDWLAAGHGSEGCSFAMGRAGAVSGWEDAFLTFETAKTHGFEPTMGSGPNLHAFKQASKGVVKRVTREPPSEWQ